MLPQRDYLLRFVSSGEPSDLFISYSHESADVVRALLEALPCEGMASRSTPLPEEDEATHFLRTLSESPIVHRVFCDVLSLRSGELWDQALTGAIFKTGVLVPILSQSYCSSPACMFELLLFLNRNFIEETILHSVMAEWVPQGFVYHRSIVPYRSERCQIPSMIQRIHAPLIPADRPIPGNFIETVRKTLIGAVEKGHSAGPRCDLPEENQDIIGLCQPELAATNVITLATWMLNDRQLTAKCREAVEKVVEFTATYLSGRGVAPAQ